MLTVIRQAFVAEHRLAASVGCAGPWFAVRRTGRSGPAADVERRTGPRNGADAASIAARDRPRRPSDGDGEHARAR